MENLIENNKLIAEFMGAKYEINNSKLPINKLWLPMHGICKYNTIELGSGKVLKYHSSWDWLMPVVQKINIIDDYRFSIQIDTMDTTILDGKNNAIIFKSDCKWNPNELINSVYEAIIEFIKWYNKNKK